jgi:hypothetical protein
MQKMTPTKIFRKTEIATEAVVVMSAVIVIGIVGYFLYSVF